MVGSIGRMGESPSALLRAFYPIAGRLETTGRAISTSQQTIGAARRAKGLHRPAATTATAPKTATAIAA